MNLLQQGTTEGGLITRMRIVYISIIKRIGLTLLSYLLNEDLPCAGVSKNGWSS